MTTKALNKIVRLAGILVAIVIGSFAGSASLFAIVEPGISYGASTSSSTVVISQTVLSEVSFAVPASNVSLGPSLGGTAGGTANGGTQVVVKTNDHLGYTMTIAASSSLGMIGNGSSNDVIPAYVPAATGVPDFAFTVPANRARFGYTVEASTTADLDQRFKDDGVSCDTGSGDTAGACWLNASTTAVTIVNRSSQTPLSGATTTLKFRVVINPSPSPVLLNDTYVATTTLTATAN